MSTRLPGSRYKDVFDRGRSVKGRLVVGWNLKSPDADRKAGVVVSKRTFRHAVDRNRAKRLVREAWRLLVKDGAVPEGMDWVFIIRTAIRDKKIGDVEEDLAALCQRVSGRPQPAHGRGVPV